jgi:hypothetical protein
LVVGIHVIEDVPAHVLYFVQTRTFDSYRINVQVDHLRFIPVVNTFLPCKLDKTPKLTTLVMDNLNTHSPSSFYETFKPKEAKKLWDRFEFVFTPKQGSWINMAEIELHALNGQCLNRHISTMEKVIEEVEAWEIHRNDKCSKINWQFTNREARIKLKRLYPSIYN